MFDKIKKELGIAGSDIFDFLDGFENLSTPTLDSTPDELDEWAKKVRNIKNNPFSFDGREYLLPIYRDPNKDIRIVKSRQIEITEFAVNLLLQYLTKNPNSVGLYLTDTQDHVSVFSKLRMTGAIDQSPVLKRLAKKGNVSWRPFKNGSHLWMYSAFRNFESARSVPADIAVVDEMQSMKVEYLPVLKEALSKSSFGKIIEIGTGGVAGDNWQKEWLRGTRLEWNFETKMWEQKSETVPGISSYHLNQYMAFWIPREQIELKKKAYPPRQFANEILGEWYATTVKPLLEKEMRTLFDRNIAFTPSEEVDHTMPVYMGIDWGGGTRAFTVPWIWQLTGEKAPRFQLLYTTKITERSTEKQADMMINLIDKYDPKRVVIDEGGGTRQVEKLSKQFEDRVIKCHFRPRPGDPFEKISGENRVNVDRTWMIECIIDLIQRPEEIKDWPHPIPRIQIPARKIEDVEWIIGHFTCIEAESVDTGTGTYVTYTNPEETNYDALMACGYALMAWLYDKDVKYYWERL
jgi:hypothetical protein